MAGTLVSYLPFTRSVTEDLTGKEWTVTGEPQIITLSQFPYKAAQFEPGQNITSNIKHGGSSTWMVEFWCFIPPITTSWESIIWTGSDDLFFNMLSIDSDGKLTIWSNTSETFSGSTAFINKSDNTYFNRWIKIQFGWIYGMPVFGASAEIYDYNDQYIEYFNTASTINSPQVRSPISTSGIIKLAGNITMKIGQFRHYSSTNSRRYDYEFFPFIKTTLPADNIISNELLVHDTINFESRNNISYTSRNKSQQWYYKNIGTTDGLLVSGTSLTNVPPSKSVTSKAFYQTNRQKCFDTQASKEIYMLFDVYFDGTNRWRAYEESSTNGQTGITAQTSGVLNIFSNSTNVGASIPLTINKLETYLLHMRSDATNGYIEVYKDGELKYTYIGNVNNGDDFSNLELQSDGSGTIFSNIVISNQQVYDYDRWTGNYTNIQRTLTNETLVPEKCLKAGLPLNIAPSINISWTAIGNVSTSLDIKKEGIYSIHIPNGAYLVANDIINLNTYKWTFDCWAYLVSSSGENGYFALSAKTDGYRCGIIVANDGIWVADGESGWQAKNESITFPSVKNQWVHLAIVKNDQQVTFYQNGTSVWSFQTTRLDNSGKFILGGSAYGYNTDIYFNQVRFLKDTALWTENFIPPTTEDYETYQNSFLSGSLDSALNVWFPFDQIIPLSFTGQNGSYAELPLSVLPGATTFTIEVKFSTTSTASYGSNYLWKTIIGREIGWLWQDDFGLCVNDGKLCFWAEPKTGGSDSSKNTTSNAIVNDGRIHSAAVVASNGAIDLYCDGKLVAHTDNVNAKITDAETILIAYNSDSTSILQMDLYELRFWSVARTEIFATIDGTEEGLQGWYKPSQNSLLDYSGNNRHATIYNASYDLTNALKSKSLDSKSKDLSGNLWNISGISPATTTINELNGKATQFGKGYIYTNPPALRSNNFTIDFWEYIPSTVNGLTAQMVVIDGTDGTGTQCLDIGYDNGATVPSFWLGKGASSGWKYSNKIIGTKIRGQWVHRAVVRYNDKIYAFENGKLYTSFAIEDGMYIDITGSSLFIGGLKRASRLHPGMLSEVRVYVGTALWTTNFTPPNQEDYFDIYWHFNKPAPILNTNYNTLRYLTNDSQTWKYINPCYNDIDHFTYTNISVTQVQPRISYTDMQLSGDITINTDIYQELWIKFDTYLGNALGTIFSFPYGKGTISISISKPESSTTYLAKIIHERNEENPTGTQLSPETSYSDYELGKIDEEISFIIYIKSDAYNKGEIIIDSSSWIDTNDNRRVALLSTGGRFHLYNANINEGNTLSKTSNVKCIYNLIVSNQELTFDDMIAHNINPAQRSIINNEEWRREKYYYHTYLPFDENVTKDLNGDTWELTNTLDIQNNACYFNGLGYLWKNSNNLANKPFTVSFYMSATSNNTGKEPYIFQLYSKKGFGLIVYSIGCKITTNGKLVFCRVFDDDFKNDFYLSTSFSILDGKMHYIECVYTGSKCLFFVDGMLIGTANSVLKSQNHGLYLGRNADTNTTFTGYLDEFRIYSGYIAHTEEFTPPVHQITDDKLYYDKSAETMKFEYFADVQKTTWILSTLTTKKVIVSYLPFDDSIEDICGNSTENTLDRDLVFNSTYATKNKSLQISGTTMNNINVTLPLKGKSFVSQFYLYCTPYDSYPDGYTHIYSLNQKNHILNSIDIEGQPSIYFSSEATKLQWFSLSSVRLLGNGEVQKFLVTSIYNKDTSTVTNIMTKIFSSLPPSSYIVNDHMTADSSPYIFDVGHNAGIDQDSSDIYTDEFKVYIDYTDDMSEATIDKNIEIRFNNDEESVYFEFYANIDLIKPLFLNIAILNCDFWVNISPSDGIKTMGNSRLVQIKSRFHGQNISSDKTLFNDASNDSYVANINNSIYYDSPFIDKMAFIAWMANSLTTDQSDYMKLTSNPDICVWFYPGTVTLKKGAFGDELFTTTMIKDYIYHLAVVIDCGTLKFYLNGQLMYSNSTILPDVIQKYMNWYFRTNNLVVAGLGCYNTNIFDTPNEINLGQIGEPPSYKITLYPFKQAGPNLIAYHNDTPYYNQLVLPTDPNASSIRIYHNNTVYALSK